MMWVSVDNMVLPESPFSSLLSKEGLGALKLGRNGMHPLSVIGLKVSISMYYLIWCRSSPWILNPVFIPFSPPMMSC